MSTSLGLQELRDAWEPSLSKRLDDAVWQAWVAKGARKTGGAAPRDWRRALAVAIPIPFVASLTGRTMRLAHNND